MSNAAHEWVDQLSDETLPVMRRTLTQVRELLNQSSVNHHHLASVIARDPGFSLHLIRQFNRLPKVPKEPVSRIELAIPLLGMAQIEHTSRTLPCLEERLQGPSQRGLIACYSRAAHAAIYASAMAQRRHDGDEGAIYTAALLHDIGEMALWSREPDRMREVLSLLLQGDGPEDAAMEVFGCTLQEISAGLSQAWGLPELVQTAQGYGNSYQPRALTVMLASALARESSLGWQRESTLDDLELLSEFLEIPLAAAHAWLHAQAAMAARELQALPIPLPAFHLIHGGPPQAGGQEAAAVSRRRTDAPSHAETVSDEARPRPAKPASPLQQLISGALHEIRSDVGLQRVMFAMLNTEKTELRARIVSETAPPPSLKDFSVALSPPSLFSLLLKKPQAIALSPANAEKYRHLIPAPLQRVINTRQCLVMSVFLRNKPIGLFYADNGEVEAITPQQFANFKTVCQRTIKALG